MNNIYLLLSVLLFNETPTIHKNAHETIPSFRATYASAGSTVMRKTFLYCNSGEMFLNYIDALGPEPRMIQFYDRKEKEYLVAMLTDNGYTVKRSSKKTVLLYEPEYTQTSSTKMILEKTCWEFSSEKQGTLWLDKQQVLRTPSVLLGRYAFLPYAFQPRVGSIQEIKTLELEADVEKELEEMKAMYFSKNE